MFQYSGLKKPLPNNVQLLTMEPWKDGTVLLRFEHVFEYNESKNLSQPIVIDVQVCKLEILDLFFVRNSSALTIWIC